VNVRRYSSAKSTGSALIVLVGLSWTAPVLAVGAAGDPPKAVLYAASDFQKLAAGVDPGFDGEADLQVWAPSQDAWRVTIADGTLTLVRQSKPGESRPRWQKLGTVKLVKGRPLKVIVSEDSSTKGEHSAATSPSASRPAPSPKDSKKGAARKATPPPRVPTLLWLSAAKDHSPESVLDLIRGRIDTAQASHDYRRNHVRTNDEGVDFQAPASAEAWRDRAVQLREQMRVALGLWPMFPKTSLNPKVYGKLDRGDYTIEKVVLETFAGFTLSGNLYRPAKCSGKVPGILCPHGHWTDGRVNPEVQARCIRWAKLGCVVFLYDMVGYNDSKPFTHAFLNDRLRRWGLSLPTLQTWNSIRALDWLTSLGDVDVARIGCTGESGGGTQTFLLTALDERVTVSAPVVMVSDTFQGGCVCENAAGLRHLTDNVEFAALAAPRPLILVGATGDWTARTMTRVFPAVRGVYSLISSTDRVSARIFDFPHNYNQTSRNAVYAAMGKLLLGIDDPRPTREGSQQPEKPEDLLTFNTVHPAPSHRKTPEELEAYLIASLGHLLDDLAPSSSASRWEAARRLLGTSLKFRVGVCNPAPAELVDRELRRIARPEFAIVHSSVGRGPAGDDIPVVRLLPAHPSGRLTIVADPRGKAVLASASGEPSALARALLSLGQSVVAFDPLFVGEACDSNNPVSHRPETAHFETYNSVPAADQMQDLATVVAWARSQPDVREVSLIAQSAAGPQTLLARPAIEGLARTVIELKNLPDPQDSGPFPPGLDLPGMFQFGGFKAAAALTAPAPLWVVRASRSFDESWMKSAYESSGAGHLLRTEPHDPGPEQIAQWVDRGE
jgi:dienelactone hydrolase